MNQEEKTNSGEVLPDVQSSSDARHIPIQSVGVRSVTFPVVVDASPAPQHTVATINMYVSLSSEQKGTHMSRFFQLLNGMTKPLCRETVKELVLQMLQTLQAESGKVEFEFPFFVKKAAPISGIPSLMSYRGGFAAEASKNGITVREHVLVPVTSLCPCSKEISRYGAHNQRSHITIDARCSENVPLEDLIRTAEENGSCELWSLLKREDEKYVTEFAYDHPKFVEDISRDIAKALEADARIEAFRLQVENFESIHNHSAYAQICFDRLTEPGS